ncbi:MAG: carboxymuconolactone decarboxylase family protein [Paralcaligenes sp.]
MNPSSEDLRTQGLTVRKEVLGADRVLAADRAVDDFTKPFREFVDTYCWGAIWTRPGLSRKNRSMINLAMIASLNRPHELQIHLRGAINNGVTADEIREIFMQVAVYAGVPAGLEGMRLAQSILAEEKH